MNWFIADGSQSFGPYSSEQLRAFAKAGKVVPQSYVRRDDQEEWIEASRVNGLFEGVLTIAPPPAIAVPATAVNRRGASAPTCIVCGSAAMMRTRIYRLSGPAVLVGWILLIPSFVGITVGCVTIARAFGVLAESEPLNVFIDQETADSLRTLKVNEDTIAKMVAGKPTDATDFVGLSAQQRDFLLHVNNVVEQERRNQATKGRGKAMAAVAGWGAGGLIIVASIVGGLLGWLLTMRKNVLQCKACSATVAAA